MFKKTGNKISQYSSQKSFLCGSKKIDFLILKNYERNNRLNWQDISNTFKVRLSGREHDKAFICAPVNLEFGLKSRPFFVVPNNGCTTKPSPFVVEGIWFGWLDWQTNTQATCLFLFINESHKFVQDHESTFAAEENDILPAYKLEQIMWWLTHCMDFTTTQIINFLAPLFQEQDKSDDQKLTHSWWVFSETWDSQTTLPIG